MASAAASPDGGADSRVMMSTVSSVSGRLMQAGANLDDLALTKDWAIDATDDLQQDRLL